MLTFLLSHPGTHVLFMYVHVITYFDTQENSNSNSVSDQPHQVNKPCNKDTIPRKSLTTVHRDKNTKHS